jgi:hypothetical protein
MKTVGSSVDPSPKGPAWCGAGHRQNADKEAGLGKLVLFDRPVKPATNTRLRERREAEIIIFPGVRYERNEKPESGTHTDDPAKPRRKRL